MELSAAAALTPQSREDARRLGLLVEEADVLQWSWADSWTVSLLQWSYAKPAQELAAELESQEERSRPVQVYSATWASTRCFLTPRDAAEELRQYGSFAAVLKQEEAPGEGEEDFSKPPAITGVGDILSLGALSLTVTTATTVGIALSPVLIARHVTQLLFANLAAPCVSRNCCVARATEESEKISIDDFRDTDRHWDPMLRVRRREPGNQSLKFPEGVVRRSLYVKMSDGVDIAVDVLLPPPPGGQRPCPCILQCARYWRAYEIRWPLRTLINNGEPWDFMHGETKAEMLLAGYAWVSADVRGCGASAGIQNVVWSDREIADVLELADWIVGKGDSPRQAWSDGRVALYGVSYDAGVALRAGARGHPAVKAVVSTFPFGDIYRELFPGGIMNKWFLQTWSEFNSVLDNASLAYVHPAAPVAVKGAAPAGPREQHDAAIAAHVENWNLMDAAVQLAGVNSTVTLPEGERITAETLNLWQKHAADCRALPREEGWRAPQQAVFPALAATGVPVMLMSGWMCVTVRVVLQAFALHALPGWRLVLGPWNHGGAQHYRYGRGTRQVQFAMAADCTSFLLRHMAPPTPSSPSVPAAVPPSLRGLRNGLRRDKPESHFYISGSCPGWVHSISRWPPPGICKRPLWLTAQRELIPSPTEEAEAELTALPQPTGLPHHIWAGNSRYVTMIKAMDPLTYTWADPAEGSFLYFESGPLEEPVTVLGSPVVSLCLQSGVGGGEGEYSLRLSDQEPGVAAGDADVFAYLCTRSNDGPPVYITEGQLRLSHRAEARQPEELAALDCPVAEDEMASAAAAVDDWGGREPYHTFLTGDKASLPLTNGSVFRARLSLLPVGYRFDQGSSIVLVISTDDVVHFSPNPTLAHSPSSVLPSLCHGPTSPSLLWLPVAMSPEHRRVTGRNRFPCPPSPAPRRKTTL